VERSGAVEDPVIAVSAGFVLWAIVIYAGMCVAIAGFKVFGK
jgi:hypothetical protein